MPNYITEQDVVERISHILHRQPYWFHGEPIVSLKGNEGGFGELWFNYTENIVRIAIFIKNKQEILAIAQSAIKNFPAIADQLYREQINA